MRPRNEATDNDLTEALQSQILLLREENAMLRAAQQQIPDTGAIVERARSLAGTSQSADEAEDEAADDAWRVMAEGLALRDALVDACLEVSQAATALESRLRALGPRELEDGERPIDEVAQSGGDGTRLATPEEVARACNGQMASPQEMDFLLGGTGRFSRGLDEDRRFDSAGIEAEDR